MIASIESTQDKFQAIMQYKIFEGRIPQTLTGSRPIQNMLKSENKKMLYIYLAATAVTILSNYICTKIVNCLQKMTSWGNFNFA